MDLPARFSLMDLRARFTRLTGHGCTHGFSLMDLRARFSRLSRLKTCISRKGFRKKVCVVSVFPRTFHRPGQAHVAKFRSSHPNLF